MPDLTILRTSFAMNALLALALVCTGASFAFQAPLLIRKATSSLSMQLTSSIELCGSQQTRSPLINWFLIERKIPFGQKPPRPSNHPFGQVPFLSDQNGAVQVFESGAILLYLADAYGAFETSPAMQTSSDAIERALYTKWVVWANSELDKLCFGSGMSGSQLDKPGRALDRLDLILSKCEWLVIDKFSVADVAIGSYLNYVPVFFPNTRPTMRPNIVAYMKRCAERPAFAEAFGDDHAQLVIQKAAQWLKK